MTVSICACVFFRYMKGRVSYEQLNAVVEGINIAVTAKYKILCQSVKALSNHSRKLQQRFKDQETKDTKGVLQAEHPLSSWSLWALERHIEYLQTSYLTKYTPAFDCKSS